MSENPKFIFEQIQFGHCLFCLGIAIFSGLLLSGGANHTLSICIDSTVRACGERRRSAKRTLVRPIDRLPTYFSSSPHFLPQQFKLPPTLPFHRRILRCASEQIGKHSFYRSIRQILRCLVTLPRQVE